jgi:hypothetical protein
MVRSWKTVREINTGVLSLNMKAGLDTGIARTAGKTITPVTTNEGSRGYQSDNRPRDEYGRFESTGWDREPGPSYSPRHEYGRFESRSSDRDYQNAQSQRGPHAGKGPKGYQRSDEWIQEDVSENLAHDSELDASEIEVKVHNGVVILTGTVSERQFKRMAEDLAERCYGVKDVRNEIRMILRQTPKRADLRRKVHSD